MINHDFKTGNRKKYCLKKVNYTKYNFIIGQCGLAEIMCNGFERKLLVNTGWPIYKVQSVLFI